MTALPRVAVVGINGHGRSHVDNAIALDTAGVIEFAAVADHRTPEPGSLPETVRVFGDTHELLAQGHPDIVVLCTPIHTHFALATAVIEAGADVLLEKPPTASLEEFEKLRAIAESNGRAVQIGFQSLGSVGIADVRDGVAAGKIGDVLSISGFGAWLRTDDYWTRAAWSGKRTLRGVPVVDGVITNPLAHAVATALAIAGTTRSQDVLEIELDQYRANDIEVDDTSSVLVRTTSGVPMAFGLALTAPRSEDPAIIIRGTAGHIVYNYTLDVARVFRDGEPPQTLQFERAELLENLVAHRLRGERLIAPLDDTGAFMTVLEAVRTAPDPAPIDPRFVTWVDDHEGRHAVVHDIERWLGAVAEKQLTFAQLGAPWASRR